MIFSKAKNPAYFIQNLIELNILLASIYISH